MKQTARLVFFAFLMLTAGAAHATARLGDWELLFDNDDGRAVALDVYRETPLILDAQGNLFFLNQKVGSERKGKWFSDVYANWQKVSGSGYAIDVSVDGDGVPWVIAKNGNRVLYLDGTFQDPNVGWIEHPGFAKARRISVSKRDNTPYIIGAASGHIFAGTKMGWKPLPTLLVDADGNPVNTPFNAVDLYVDSHKSRRAENPGEHTRIYMINQDRRIYTYDVHAPSSAWKELPGNARALRVAALRGLTYILGEDRKFYSLHFLEDKTWRLAGPGTGKDLACSEVDIFHPFTGKGTSTVRYLWTVGNKGRVFRAFIGH